MKRDIVAEFNALDGKKVTKSQLIKLRELATEQIRPDIAERLDKVIAKGFPSTWWGAEKSILISIKKKVKWPDPEGLSCPGVDPDQSCGCMTGEEAKTFGLQEIEGFEQYPELDAPIGLGKAVTPDEIYQYITDLLINTINRTDFLPWQRSWEKSGLAIGKEAANFITKKRYRGINYILLNYEVKNDKDGNGYLEVINWDNPYFMTFKQIEEKGGKLKKGAKGHRVVYFTKLFGHSEERADGTKLEFYSYDQKKFRAWIMEHRNELSILKRSAWSVERVANLYIPILKYYNVFNGSDIEGVEWGNLDELVKAPISKIKKIEVAESIVLNYPNPPKILYRGDQPYYQPATDTVVQTPIADFKDAQNFYSVLFHELVHSTGHRSRLNRPFGKSKTPAYAKEELIAEMGAVFLCAESGILFRTLSNSVAYLKGWNASLVKNMKEDNRFFFRAASAAQAASDHILDRDLNGVPKYRKKMPKTTKKTKSMPTKASGPISKGARAKRAGVQLGLFGSFTAPLKPTLKETLEFAESKLYGRSIYHRDIKKKVIFTKSGIKKAIMGKRGLSKIRLQLVYLAPQILKSSRLVVTEKDKKSRKQILNIHKLNCYHTINGQEYKIFIVLRESLNGNIYYDHDAIKIKKHVVKPGDGSKKKKSAPLGSDNMPDDKITKKKGSKKDKGLGSPIVLDSGHSTLPTPKPEEANGDASSMVLGTSPAVPSKKEVVLEAPPKERVPAVRKQNGLISSSELMDMDFETLEFSGEWSNFMQNPAKNMKVAFYGKPKNGKTVGACMFANYLTNFGNLLYNFADQGINKSTQDIWRLTGLEGNQNAFLTDTRDLGELERLCATGEFQFVIIDLINTYIKRDNLTPADFEDRFIKKYPNISFIYIMEATKSGDFRGGQDWMHLPDAIVNVEDYVMSNNGRYGMGEYIIWEDGLRKKNPKRYGELMDEKDDIEEVDGEPIGEIISLT